MQLRKKIEGSIEKCQEAARMAADQQQKNFMSKKQLRSLKVRLDQNGWNPINSMELHEKWESRTTSMC